MPEQDRYAKGQHEPGAKLDLGKNRLGLVLGEFARALWEVGRVGTYGADKYTPKGWLEVPDGEERYEDALMRHYLEHKKGELIDQESQILHLAHQAWNNLAWLELLLRNSSQSTQKPLEQILEEEQDHSLSQPVKKVEELDTGDSKLTLSQEEWNTVINAGKQYRDTSMAKS